jgi:DNA invertase Pin-like site-specific DNA recombinase
MRVAIYTRVSTDAQTTENQLRELEAVARHRGWNVVGVYADNGVSGSKGRDKRPQFDRLHDHATQGKFDLIAAWSVDRLGRSLIDLVAFLQHIDSARVGLYLHQQALDTTTPAGRALFQMLGVFSEFERSMIRERVKAGMRRARNEGKRIGRPRLSDSKLAKIDKLAAQGISGRQIAAKTGIPEASVRRRVTELRKVAA